ncbi:MAG: molybdopterin-dependent oxidoreductase [Desulfurococcales archaeon]|nr:molybdopterin-dependent oxidoreductase [Desulfurococcales archaeon]
MPDWCMIYKNWATMLTGYPTVIDCKPSGGEDPKQAINELYLFLLQYNEGNERFPEPVHQPPELIGQRFLVYKALGGGRRNPLYELRSVYDRESDRVIWMGGVYKSFIPGSPNKPMRQPVLPPLPDDITPPSTPQGQKMIRKPVVYSAEGPFPEAKDESISIGYYDENAPQPQVKVKVDVGGTVDYSADFHCVTGWSVGGVRWKGVPLLDLLSQHGLKGKWIVAVSTGGYTTVIPFEERLLDDAFLVTHLGDERLPREHGGPYRLILPKLFGWKSLKWVDSILVGDVYIDGFWEARGYHWRGLVVLNERFKTY